VVKAEDETISSKSVVYSFLVVPEGKVPRGASLIVHLPAEIKTGQLTLQSNLGFADEPKISFDSSKNEI
jgi:hypothetical protein